MMKKLLVLIVLLVSFLGGTAAPILHNLGFGTAVAHAQDDQGEDNDDQGEDEQ